jgi:chemotaxis methyl-accepting protein methylase
MKDTQFHQLIDRFGFSWTGYRRVRGGVKKRIVRHMHEIRCRNIHEYIETIEKDHEKRLQFERLMTVSISRFFRDGRLWEIMQEEILPLLAQKSSQTIKVWSAGCALGEEVYSFKILWEDLRKSYPDMPDIYILATDMSPEYLERAKTAVYPRSSMSEVPKVIRSTYFEKVAGGRYALRSWMRDGIVWQIHNLLSAPIRTAFDLIFLRNNLLTYHVDEVKIPAIARIVNSLSPGGFFIIGNHERMPNLSVDLKPWRKSTVIFQKQYLDKDKE